MAASITCPVETDALAVRPVQRDRDSEQRVIYTLISAFADDPAVRWMYPDQQQFRRYFPAFVKAFGGEALACGTAVVSGDHAGAALWLAPGITPDEEALAALLQQSLANREKEDAFALFDEMAHYHPEEPHWYLPLIGVLPTEQGRGHGSALLRYALRRCDEAGLPAYLESTSPRSVPLYRRHGFEVTGEIRVGRCPPIFPMVRPARR